MTKLKILILILSLIAINCKKSTEPELTLADRAGTYKIVSTEATYQFTIYEDGYIITNQPASTQKKYLAEPTSTATVFYLEIDGMTIDFSKMTVSANNLLDKKPTPFIKVS